MPQYLNDTEACAAWILEWAGPHLRVAAPLGLGKPPALLNALYARVRADPGLSLTLYTALSLMRPRPAPGLEARFAAPFIARHFGAGFEDLDYALDQAGDRLPENVYVHEFYLQSGALLRSRQAQRDYISLNYTHVARDLVPRDINVVVQRVAMCGQGAGARLSLGSNPDVTLDLLDRLRAAGRPRPLMVAVVHPQMPFTGGGAEVASDYFDALLQPATAAPLFALPHEPVDAVEHAIGYHASALVRDGGTLQIGIGALSDALVAALLARHRDPQGYAGTLAALDGRGGSRALAAQIGGTQPFRRGLYGASEMVMDGFMHLRRAGILVRNSYDDLALEKALVAGAVGETLTAGAALALYRHGVLPARLDAHDLARLQRFGILPEDAYLQDGRLCLGDGSAFGPDFADPAVLAALDPHLAGRRLRDGRYLRGAFLLGSHTLYAWLRGLDGDDWSGLDMTRVSDVNQLYGGREQLDALQRRDARFFNTCMMATLTGAAVSDGLEDGRVVSGVGGQYNFVAMAHALNGGRSVLLLRATRRSGGRTHSNIRWHYGHTTIPRHLRDLVITEYGIADLRGRSDEDCIKAMLAISDARFLEALAAQAQAAGKLDPAFRIPDAWRSNTPQALRQRLAPARAAGYLPAFPLGCDFTPLEQRLLPALRWLGRHTDHWRGRLQLLRYLLWPGAAVAGEDEALQRMGLARPSGPGQRLQRRALLVALRHCGD